MSKITKYNFLQTLFYDQIIAPASFNSKINYLNLILSKINSDSKILDVGCGDGKILNHISNFLPHSKLFGIDNSIEQIKLSNKLLNKKHVIANLQVISADEIEQFQEDEFDFIYSIASIKHWEKRSHALKTIHQKLKKGGLLLITELDRSAQKDAVFDFINSWGIPNFLIPIFVKIYDKKVISQSVTSSEIINLVNELEFKIIESKSLPNSPAFYILASK